MKNNYFILWYGTKGLPYRADVFSSLTCREAIQALNDEQDFYDDMVSNGTLDSYAKYIGKAVIRPSHVSDVVISYEKAVNLLSQEGLNTVQIKSILSGESLSELY